MTRERAEKRPLWQFPWALRESFIFAWGILIIGYMLQFLLGSLRSLSFPGNLIILIASIAVICFLHLKEKNSDVVRWLRSGSLSIACISMLLLQALIMGIVPQNNSPYPNPHDIFGITDVMSSWPFVLSILFLLINLGFIILHRAFPFRVRNIGFLANHLGLWIALASGILGAGDLKRYTMNLEEGETEWIAMDGAKEIEMPFALQLNDFEMELYTPKVTIVNTTTNEVLTKGKNAMRQITEGDEFDLDQYHIRIVRYFEEARSILDRYEPVNDFGAAPAALVEIKSENGIDTTAWISCGSFASFPTLVRFDTTTALVMMEPEPKRFSSHVTIFTPEGIQKKATIEVNQPYLIKGWKIYQVSYNDKMGKYSPQSTVELIQDPWLPAVYTGIFLMIAGAIYMIFTGYKKKNE